MDASQQIEFELHENGFRHSCRQHCLKYLQHRYRASATPDSVNTDHLAGSRTRAMASGFRYDQHGTLLCEIWNNTSCMLSDGVQSLPTIDILSRFRVASKYDERRYIGR